MKPIISTFLFFLSITLVMSQSAIELSIGPNWSNVSMQGLDASLRPHRTMHSGLTAQVLLHHDFEGSSFGFSTGLSFKEKGFIIGESLDLDILNLPMKVGIEANTTLQYLEVPLNLKYTASTGPVKAYIFAGPTVGYAPSGDIRTKANFLVDFNITKTKLNLNDNLYNRIDLGANLGIGTEIAIGQGSILIQASYNQGLNRVVDNTIVDLKLKNYGFGMNIGYKIPLH